LKRLFFSLTVLAIFVVASTSGYATPFISHVGSNDPNAEGWYGGPTGTSTAGPVDDGGTPAWFTRDVDSAGFCIYGYNPTSQEVTDINTNGWELHAIMRPTWINDPPDWGVGFTYRSSTADWKVHFGTDGSGNAIAKLIDGPSSAYATINVGNSNYNDYRLVFNPASGTADFFVNDVLQASGYSGDPNYTGNQVYFGAGTWSETGESNWNLVEFGEATVIPEPTTILLMGCGLLGLFGIGIRHRRKNK